MLYLPDFLKKYSTIPNKFIDDFFTLYDYKTNDNDLIINFDNLCKWLNCRKDVLKKTLDTSYINNVDYSIKIIKLQFLIIIKLKQISGYNVLIFGTTILNEPTNK